MKRPNHVVFIHGLAENAQMWTNWIAYFAERGYRCHAPNYPYHEGQPSELRHNPNPQLHNLRLKEVLSCFENFIDGLPETPILIGHSMGGLIVQKLIAKRKGQLGICIASVPPPYIFVLRWKFLKANLPAINPLQGKQLFKGSKKWFHYSICNTHNRSEADLEYEQNFIPVSRNLLRRRRAGKIKFKDPHLPLLFIAAEKDRISPAALNYRNARAYRDQDSVIDFVNFIGRSHYICKQRGWEQVAEYITTWIALQTYQVTMAPPYWTVLQKI